MPIMMRDGLSRVEVSSRRSSGTHMLKAVLSNVGVLGGSSSSDTRGPSEEAFWVVARMGMERILPGEEGENMRGE